MAAGFARSAVLLFLALRAGDLVALAAGMWFVPRYVSPEDIGAVLPLTSFATFLSLPAFAFAMTVMKESSWLAAKGERGKIRSLLAGVFAASGALLAAVVAVSVFAVPLFLGAMGVEDAAAGVLCVSAAFLGCVAPVYTDSLQSLRRFRALAAVEALGAAFRFLVMLAAMPFRALAGYFAGQAALPAFRIAGSVFAVRRDLAVAPEPFWNRESARRVAISFLSVLAYQAFPMAASLVEQSVLRTALPGTDSAGYYMVSRFSDMLYYFTFPMLLVMFPYTAAAARRNEPTRPYVLKCAAATIASAALLGAAYVFWGVELLSLMPNGADYAGYARFMPCLVAITALTTCQVFYTNSEVSAGRFGFLRWLVPLHAAYPAALWLAEKGGLVRSLDGILVFFAAASFLRFAFAALGCARRQPAAARCGEI
ncbi:MAG: hypothetical protein ILO34_08325 [Kiritimatiellae bacterium]|nr:hypothetical protein [Kiritimatiellia bacterium]